MDAQHALAILEEFIIGDDYPSITDALEAIEFLRDTIASYETVPVTGLRQMSYCTNCGEPMDEEYADICDRCQAVLCRVCFIEHLDDCKMVFVKGERKHGNQETLHHSAKKKGV